ncbi:MAG: DUF2089 family protein [Phycisphaerales bacterium]
MENTIPDWAKGLNEEDWQFIKRLLLASGSLKDVAQQYTITYPTIRIKLNRLIEKIQILDSKKTKSKFHQKLQVLVIEGKIDLATAKSLLKIHEETLNNEGKNI